MDYELYLRAIMALGIVLALIAAITWAVKRWGPGAGMRPSRQKKRRLGIVEIQQLDPRRRLILIHRDGVEHLLLTGGGTDLLVESGIGAHLAPDHKSFAQTLGDQE